MTEAGKSEVAIARMQLDMSGHITSTVVLVEETAKSKLRGRIARELGAATLPVLPGRNRRDLTIDFKRP